MGSKPAFRRSPLKHLPLFIFLLVLLVPSMPAAAQTFQLASDTILRLFERDGDLAAPIYEYLQLDTGRDQGPVSFHLYGWGRVDVGGSDYLEDVYGESTAGELLYGYAEYLQPDSTLMVRLGRQYIFHGITTRSFDGIRVDTDLTDLFSLSTYFGQPVSVQTVEELDGEVLVGGRIAHHWRGLYEIGLSYKNLDTGGDRELLGIDTALFLPGGIYFTGFSSEDLGGTGWAEHTYQLSFDLGPFRLRPFFEKYRFQDYFDAGAEAGSPFRFLVPLADDLTIFGSDAIWSQDEWELGLKGKYYDYDDRGGTSQYYAALAIWHGEDLTQIGGELGFMEGDLDQTDYLLARLYGYWDSPPPIPWLHFATAEVVNAYYYDEDIYGEDASIFLSFGAGRHFLNEALEIRAAVDFSSDPYFDEDLRGWLLAKFVFGI